MGRVNFMMGGTLFSSRGKLVQRAEAVLLKGPA